MSFEKTRFLTSPLGGLSTRGAPASVLIRLAGDAMKVAVERAVHELRQGRAVLIRDSERCRAVAAAEMLGAEGVVELAKTLGEDIGLVLSAPRLQHIGTDAAGPMRLALDGLSAAEVEGLFATAHPATVATTGRDASPLEAAALDLVRMAQLLPAAVVMPAEAVPGIGVSVEMAAIALYHDRSARDLHISARARVPLDGAVEAEFVLFSGGGFRDQVAIVVGNPDPARPVLTRLHSACLTGDLFGSLKCDCGEQLRLSVKTMAKAGGGLLLYLDQEGRGIGLRNKLRAYALQAHGHDTLEADAALGYGPDERRYGIAAKMLDLLGIGRVIMLTNNPDKIRALADIGVVVEGYRPLLGTVNPHNVNYLTTKAARAGHLLGTILAQPAAE